MLSLLHFLRLLSLFTFLFTCSCTEIISAFHQMDTKYALGIAEQSVTTSEQNFNEIVSVNTEIRQVVNEIQQSVENEKKLETAGHAKLKKLR